MIFLGIDPGTTGGLALLNGDGVAIWAFKMPDTAHELHEKLEYHDLRTPMRFGCRAFLEKVSSSPQMGVVSSFTFGKGVGRIEGVLAALHIPYEEVTPGVWQRKLGCLTKGNKNISKAKARQLWPVLPDGLKHTHWLCDALLIAEYGRLKEMS